MWWNKILNWFSEYGERKQVINNFNKHARDAFINNDIPILLKAETTFGNSNYKHQFSNLLFSGIKIRILGGCLTNNEIASMGGFIICNMSRILISLGFDTLQITNSYGTVIKEWELAAMLELNFNDSNVRKQDEIEFYSDKKNIKEGDFIIIYWNCPNSEMVKLRLNNGYTFLNYSLNTKGSKQFKISRFSSALSFTLFYTTNGLNYRKTIIINRI